MQLKSFLILIIISMFSMEVFASFSRSTCSSPDAKISYTYFQSWNMPEATDVWVIDGISYPGKEVILDIVTPETILEEYSSQMTGGRIYTKKVTLKYFLKNENTPQNEITFTTWLLCKTSGGM